jgi:hypothetical protein
MTDYEIDLLATAVAQKVAAILAPPLPALLKPAPEITVTIPPTAGYIPKRRGWPKGKKRK